MFSATTTHRMSYRFRFSPICVFFLFFLFSFFFFLFSFFVFLFSFFFFSCFSPLPSQQHIGAIELRKISKIQTYRKRKEKLALFSLFLFSFLSQFLFLKITFLSFILLFFCEIGSGEEMEWMIDVIIAEVCFSKPKKKNGIF